MNQPLPERQAWKFHWCLSKCALRDNRLEILEKWPHGVCCLCRPAPKKHKSSTLMKKWALRKDRTRGRLETKGVSVSVSAATFALAQPYVLSAADLERSRSLNNAVVLASVVNARLSVYCSFMKDETFSFSVLTHENPLKQKKTKQPWSSVVTNMPFYNSQTKLTFLSWLSVCRCCFVL